MTIQLNSDDFFESDEGAIAIVAMHCRLPGASDIDEFWKILCEEQCTLTDIDDDEIQRCGISKSSINNPHYVKKAGVLEDIECFDSRYFDMSAIEADILDVQQRAMLESSVTLLNHANIDPARYDGRIGVFAGSAFSSYLFGILERNDVIESLGDMMIRHANDKDFLATRVSYKLNLSGPSVNIQTACSTGLVSVHAACQSLMLGECDSAIAGAVNIKVPQRTGYIYQPDGVLSPDGNCKPFDSESNGTIFTNGLGLVLLKKLEDAVRDGDEIYAVIKGSATSNDGADKVGFTAPSIKGQVQALTEAIEVSGVNAEDIQYIEAHGTGTALGDPIEIEAIKQAYGEAGLECGIGSLKANFGHLNIAAGIIGLIKAALILKHGTVPSTLHISDLNPMLGLDDSRFYVADKTRSLNPDRSQAVAVSAFGMGGTNCHVILRGYTKISDENCGNQEEKPGILTLSAKSASALERTIKEYQQYLSREQASSFGDVVHTAYYGRPHLPYRAALVASSCQEAATILASGNILQQSSDSPGLSAFVFSGQGTQHINMGSTLAAQCPSFRQNLDRILAVFLDEHDLDLSSYLWNEDKVEEISATRITQPLLFAVELAIAETLSEFGIRPDFILGHSLGEVIAATFSGVFDLKTAAALVVKRAECMDKCQPGAMLAIGRVDGLESCMGAISVAAINGPEQSVLAGSFADIESIEKHATEKGIAYQRLKTSHAFHSPLMEPGATEFLAFMKEVRFGNAHIPIISNITGNPLTEYEYKNPLYWADHLLKTVQFSGSLQTLNEKGVNTYVEIGHGSAMKNLILSVGDRKAAESLRVIPALGRVEDEYQSFMNVIAAYWTLFGTLDLSPFVEGNRSASLPVYPFEKSCHWIEPVIGFRPRTSESNLKPEVILSHNNDVKSDTADATEPDNTQAAETEAPQDTDDNPVEAIVEDIYSSYLGGDIKRDQSFFDMGGNSLVAIQMINKLRETFNLDIPMRGFYENSSVSAISLQIAEQLLAEEEVACA